MYLYIYIYIYVYIYIYIYIYIYGLGRLTRRVWDDLLVTVYVGGKIAYGGLCRWGVGGLCARVQIDEAFLHTIDNPLMPVEPPNISLETVQLHRNTYSLMSKFMEICINSVFYVKTDINSTLRMGYVGGEIHLLWSRKVTSEGKLGCHLLLFSYTSVLLFLVFEFSLFSM